MGRGERRLDLNRSRVRAVVRVPADSTGGQATLYVRSERHSVEGRTEIADGAAVFDLRLVKPDAS